MSGNGYDSERYYEQWYWYDILYARGRDSDMKRVWLYILVFICISFPAVSQYTGLNSGGAATTTISGCAISGCAFTGMVTTAAQGLTSPNGTNFIMTSGGAANPFIFKSGPTGGGPILLELGGSIDDVAPQTNIDLPGGTWGAGALVNNVAPINQNATFSGSTTYGQAAFGAFLQQTDNSSNTGNGTGLTENLILNGSGVVGWRGAGAFDLIISSPTGNTSSMGYTGLTGRCVMAATDTTTGASCFGGNLVATVYPGIKAAGNVGLEIDTQEEAGAVIGARIGEQIVDVLGSTYGTQASQDDVALSLNNQYAPSPTLGFKIGFEFGRFGGNFPVATNGTLIGAQGPAGTGFTVSNGIDWHLGTFSGNSWNDGHTILTGAGEIIVSKITDPGTAPGAGSVKLTAEAGTNPGTCKIVVRAGTSSVATTLLDNIGGSC
jgi:hypothetical protein